MKPAYAHLTDDWPNYRWDHESLADSLSRIHFRRGELIAGMANVGFEMRQEAILRVLMQDVTGSSEIEGEHLDERQVRSSLARKMGLPFAGLPVPEQRVEGVVEMMLDATQRFDQPLTQERLFGWHNSLFPTGYSGLYKVNVAGWRDDAQGPMVVVSGRLGKETIHFEAPAADRLPKEMARFLEWFEHDSRMDSVLKAGVAHLWFVTVHPFEDGNGRIARAVMDMALARADNTPQRFYSMTAQILADKHRYYRQLEAAQRGSMDITSWLAWFLNRIAAAITLAEDVIEIVRRKQSFWDQHRELHLTARQTKLINMLFDGFQGKLQTAKYSRIAKCSKDTALRDLADLVQKGILVQAGSGRGTHYLLAQ